MGKLPHISLIHTAYIAEDSSFSLFVPEMLSDKSNLKQIKYPCFLKDAYFSEGIDVYINAMIAYMHTSLRLFHVSVL